VSVFKSGSDWASQVSRHNALRYAPSGDGHLAHVPRRLTWPPSGGTRALAARLRGDGEACLRQCDQNSFALWCEEVEGRLPRRPELDSLPCRIAANKAGLDSVCGHGRQGLGANELPEPAGLDPDSQVLPDELNLHQGDGGIPGAEVTGRDLPGAGPPRGFLAHMPPPYGASTISWDRNLRLAIGLIVATLICGD
jgi:hypothetical protein